MLGWLQSEVDEEFEHRCCEQICIFCVCDRVAFIWVLYLLQISEVRMEPTEPWVVAQVMPFLERSMWESKPWSAWSFKICNLFATHSILNELRTMLLRPNCGSTHTSRFLRLISGVDLQGMYMKVIRNHISMYACHLLVAVHPSARMSGSAQSLQIYYVHSLIYSWHYVIHTWNSLQQAEGGVTHSLLVRYTQHHTKSANMCTFWKL